MRLPVHCDFFAGLEGEQLAKWVQARIPVCAWGWSNYRALGVFRGNSLIGGVIFHDFNPISGVMCMSAAGHDGWLSRRVLMAMHSYIFDKCKCRLAVLQVSEKNATMRAIAKRYGYQETLIPGLRGPDEAEAVLTLDQGSWRNSKFHMRKDHGQGQSADAA